MGGADSLGRSTLARSDAQSYDALAQTAGGLEPFDQWFVRVSRKCCDRRRWLLGGTTGGTTTPPPDGATLLAHDAEPGCADLRTN